MKDMIIKLFKEVNKLFSFEDLVNHFKLKDTNEINDLSYELCRMEDEYLITHNKQGLFQTYEFFNLFVGHLLLNKKGFGFVEPLIEGDDLFIPLESFLTAMDHDLVLCGIKTSNGKTEGYVKRVIERAHSTLSGKVTFFHKKYFLQTLNVLTFKDIIIDESNSIELHQGEMVKCQITKFFDNGNIQVKATEVIEEDKRADIYSILYTAGVDVDFSKECLEECETLDELNSSDNYHGYKDCTNELIYTIDSVHTKDIDDAVRCERLKDGNYLLGVYIADVSFFVRNESFIDADAIKRGTSIYPVDMVVPMLPEKLSNDLCSLNEGVVRRALACEMTIDPSGEVIDYSIFKALIKSKHKLAYEHINELFDNNTEYILKYDDILSSLYAGKELAEILNKKRTKEGSFFFEDDEARIVLNEEGKVEDIVKVERGISEKMIEEFMIEANCTVAKAMEYLEVPFIYRVHEGPKDEKLTKLLSKLPVFGYNKPIKDVSKIKYILQDILKENNPNEKDLSLDEYNRRLIINREIIRSMSKAVYQEVNVGHFGLAKESYCHFTSPIRRYPDLMVHRLIKQFLLFTPDDSFNDPMAYYTSKVNFASRESSKLERLSESIERDVNKYKETEYMERFIGDIFEGNISSITGFGIYVALDNLIEGLSRYQDMRGYFEYDELKQTASCGKLVYHIGDRVVIRVMDADKLNRAIDFKIIRKVADSGF